MSSRKKLMKGAQNIFASLLGACILFFSLQLPAVTAEGKQCPTAPVQSIAVPVKSCCLNVKTVAYRAPKPGDKEFVQCRCAEKKSSQVKLIAAPRFVLLISNPAEWAPIPRAAKNLVLHDYEQHCASVEFPPSVRPPATA